LEKFLFLEKGTAAVARKVDDRRQLQDPCHVTSRPHCLERVQFPQCVRFQFQKVAKHWQNL